MNLLTAENAEKHPRIARTPRRVGMIPDGIRRCADQRALGSGEVPVERSQREHMCEPSQQIATLRSACTEFAERNFSEGVALLVLGDRRTRLFPHAWAPLPAQPKSDDLRADLLVHYGWQWDLSASPAPTRSMQILPDDPLHATGSRGAARMDPIMRWSGRRRLSGSLPHQSSNADVYVVDVLWLDVQSAGFVEALCWYARREMSL